MWLKTSSFSSPVDRGLVCVLKTLEACRTAKVVGGEGKQFLKSSWTKCLHYYLYYLDKESGFHELETIEMVRQTKRQHHH